MSGIPPWWSMLPKSGETYGPDIGQMINAQQLAEKMRLQRRAEQGYNAIGALYANPENIDERGNLRPGVIQRAMGEGVVPAQVGLEVMGDQAKLAQQSAQTMVAGARVRDDNRKWLIDSVTVPAYSRYQDVLASTGDRAQAQRAAQEVYTTGLDAAKRDGRLTPQEGQSLLPSFDPDRARANILGSQGIAAQEKEARDFTVRTDHGRNPPVEYRQYKDGRTTDISGAASYTPTGVGEAKGAEAQLYTGQVDDGKGGKKQVTVRMGPMGGWVDTETNAPVQGVSGIRKVGTRAEETPEETARPTGPENLSGEDYLKALPASRASLIRSYAQGRVAFPGSFSLRSPYWQKMVADITQYDPSFDAVNYGGRASTRRDFTSGPSSRNVTSLNTAIGHLGRLMKAGEALNNTSFPAYNSIANFVASNTGDPRVKEFELARQAVATELERAFRGTGGSLTGIQEWQRSLSAAGSPEQLKGAIGTAVDLLASRVDAVGEAYRRGMGTTADVTELLTPSAKKTLAALPGGEEILSQRGLRPQGPRGEPAPAEGKPQAAGSAVATAPIPPAKAEASPQSDETPPISVVPETLRKDGTVVTLRDSSGVERQFVVSGNGKSLQPLGK